MTISPNKVVSVSYHLSTTDPQSGQKKTVEKTEAEYPFVFLYGAGGLLEDFERNLNGLKAGDTFDFVIAAANGYGNFDPEYIINIPIDAFRGEDGLIDTQAIAVGNELPMMDSEGNRLTGTVKDVTADHVKMDFNHPLAGCDLHFEGAVLEIRDASAEELAHGHVHGPGGHHH